MADRGACSETEDKGGAREKTSNVADEELDLLLDDALKDFSKPEVPASSSSAVKDEDTRSKASKSHSEAEHVFKEEDFEALFTEEGLARMTEELSKSFPGLPDMNLDLLREMNDSSYGPSGIDDELQSGQSLDENIEQAWKSMAQNLKDAREEKEDDFLDREFMNAMKGLGLDSAGESPENFITMMQGMMTNLLSKDILYPSLKEVQVRYPAWLEENRSKLNDDEFSRFSRQQELISRVCLEFESEKPNDSDAVKTARTEKIMELMQNMQKYGQPPMDILEQMEADGSSGPEKLNLDSAEQCVCM